MANTEAEMTSDDAQQASQSTPDSADLQEGQAVTTPEKNLNGDAKAAYGFSDLNQSVPAKAPADMDFILDVPLEISVELGNTRMQIHELLKLSQGSIIELTKNAGESLEILANRRLIARGEVVVANEKYGIRVTEIISPMERVEKLK